MNIFENVDKEQSLTKIQLTITLILILFFSVTGATYAYFAISISNNTTINGEAATVNLTLDVEKIFPTEDSTNTGVLVPQLSVSGSNSSPLATALKSGCIDANANVVCQVYKINIQNIGGTAKQVVDGKISFFGNAGMTVDISTVMPSLRWKLITSADATAPINSELGTNVDLVASSNDDVFADDILMPIGEEFDYYIIIWINESNEEQATDEGNSFFGKIEFNSSNGTGVTSTFGS